MQRCLQLSKIGLRKAAPNPSVGAILVYKNNIISEGYTSPFGGAHAEVNCLQNIDDKEILNQSTLYVSLEPCSHYGKTPPCSNLIIEKGIKKVVVACLDPNPKVAGNGIEKLQKAGIEVKQNILHDEAIAVNKRFFTFYTKKRPYIILKWAQTPNGFFAPTATETKKQFWITNKKTKALVHSWRSQEMAILVGENTIITDNPRLNTRLVAGKNPLRIIINTQQKLNEKAIVFTDGNPTILFSNFDYNIDNKTNKVISITDKKSIVEQVLDYLYRHEINSLIVEGGAYTLNEFITNNMWDEARILYGVNELEQGIKAPKIKGTDPKEYNIGTDLIKILKNPKA